MFSKVNRTSMVLGLLFLVTAIFATDGKLFAQTSEVKNLLQNPNAESKAVIWRGFDNAKIEAMQDGNSVFVIRGKGHFYQDVVLPQDAAGKYALLIAKVSSERINTDGTITGLPSLYGYMMDKPDHKGGRILEYLEGQQMLSNSKQENEWVTAKGIFKVPDGTEVIRFFLSQAERKGVPQNGSAARFDNVGLYLFDTLEEAKAFTK